MKWIVCLVATALLVCGSDQARIRRQFGTFDYPSNQFGNQFFPNQGNNGFFPGQGQQNQFGGPNGVLFPGQNGFNQGGNGFQQGGQGGQNGFQQGGQGGQNGFQGNQGNQGNFQQGGQQGGQNGFQQGGQQGQGFQQGGQQGGQRQQTTAAPVVTQPPTTLAPQLQRCVDGCIGVTTNQYNPVCGTDNQTYHNQERLDCARECGVSLQRQAIGVCPRATG